MSRLRDALISAARSLLGRPAELRGPFKVDPVRLRKVAALPTKPETPEPLPDGPMEITITLDGVTVVVTKAKAK